ncbi:chitinase [Flavobacterium sp. FlaQc-57]|uniref:chitinase n=1 Tax=Flavobacterium sp. FlaQc-57 TaxID=3374186 RepID=UPI003757D969
MYQQLKITALILMTAGIALNASSQSILKVGDNPFIINSKAALDVESVTKGFLPPRMTKSQRNAIISPPAGLQIWCTDCNASTEPVSGQPCIYLGSRWAPLNINSTAVVTTGKKSDTNKPIRTNSTTATIKGILVEPAGIPPKETGIIYKPITGGDFETLPLLDGSTGAATSPVNKATTSSPVIAKGGSISVNIAGLGANPYYFRTYAKSDLGISYGNPIIFNCATPVLTTPTVTGSTTLYPKFSGTLNINAGTQQGTITEYGYYSGTSASPTTNKIVLSNTQSLNNLDTVLNSEIFKSNPVINFNINDYVITTSETQYLRFYAIANGAIIYSPDVSFAPNAINAITGSVTNIGETSFFINGNTVTNTGVTITENGFCWSAIYSEPTITNSTTTLAPITKSFSATINNLTASTTYYIRAFAQSNNTTTYGKTLIVTTSNKNISAVELLMTNNQFSQLFPYRANLTLNQTGTEFYSYQSLIDAVNELKNIKIEIIKRQNTDLTYINYTYKIKRTDLKKNTVDQIIVGQDYNESWNISKPEIVTSVINFSSFLNSGNSTNDKKELCAFLANISHETTGGGNIEPTKTYGLYFKEENGCESGCNNYTAVNQDFPAVTGKFYHGRGPIQLSWNYNYGISSFLIYGDKNVLLSAPETVLANAKNAFMTAITFWNMPEGIKPSPHDVINTTRGFAKTINIINGGIECGVSNSAKDPLVADRIGFYKKYLTDFGVTITESDTELSCRDLATY